MLKRVRIKNGKVEIKKLLEPEVYAVVVVSEYINGKNNEWEALVRTSKIEIIERLSGSKYEDITSLLEHANSITVVNERMPEIIVSIWFGKNEGMIVDVGV